MWPPPQIMNRFREVSSTPPFHASITPLQSDVKLYELPPKLFGGHTLRRMVLGIWLHPVVCAETSGILQTAAINMANAMPVRCMARGVLFIETCLSVNLMCCDSWPHNHPGSSSEPLRWPSDIAHCKCKWHAGYPSPRSVLFTRAFMFCCLSHRTRPPTGRGLIPSTGEESCLVHR